MHVNDAAMRGFLSGRVVAWWCLTVWCACSAPPQRAPEAGPHPLWSSNKDGLDNPWPDARLQAEDGTPRLRPRYWDPFVALPAATVETDALFESYAQTLANQDGFGAYAPWLVRVSAPVDATSLTQQSIRLCQLPGGGCVPTTARWRVDPGYLEVQPGVPLAQSSTYALVLTRAVTSGGRPLTRAAEFAAYAQGDGAAVVNSAAQAAGVDVLDVVLVVTVKTLSITAQNFRAAAWAQAHVPQLLVPSTPTGGNHPRGTFAPAAAHAAFDRDRAGLGLVVVGTVMLANARDAQGAFSAAVLDGSVAPALEEVEVVVALPDPAVFPPPWRTVVAQHGFAGTNRFVLDVAREFNEAGLAVVGLDAVDHGQRGNVAAFFDVTRLATVRDRFRQTVLDQLQLVALVQSGRLDVDGVPGADLDGTTMYFGHSFGAVTGALHAAWAGHAPVTVLNASGGGITTIMDSPKLRGGIALLVRPALGLDFSSPGYEETLPFVRAVAQTVLEPADPIHHGAVWGPRGAARVLLQLDEGDGLVPNAATVALAQAAGVEASTTAREDPQGLDVLWTLGAHDLPAGLDPHDVYFHNAAARQQAATFLASGGTRLLEAP
jgi:hypothetical protein